MGPFTFLKREIRASLVEADVLCLQLRSLMTEGNPLWARERFVVELLAREALSNAVRHGCQKDEAKHIAFECRLGGHRAILKVEDEGPGFDWRSALTRSPDEVACEGRGLALYQLHASRFFFNPCGNRILLIRTFSEPTMSEHTPSDGTKALLHPGDLTATTVDRVREQLKALLQGGAKEVTVDLAGVQMVDSMGIGLLIQTHNSLSKIGGSLVVKHASSDLLDLFRSMRLDKRFTLQD